MMKTSCRSFAAWPIVASTQALVQGQTLYRLVWWNLHSIIKFFGVSVTCTIVTKAPEQGKTIRITGMQSLLSPCHHFTLFAFFTQIQLK